MIVAWQFTAWIRKKNESVSYRRFDLIGSDGASFGHQDPRSPIIPSLRDGTFFYPFPGSKLPGYDRSVPGRRHPGFRLTRMGSRGTAAGIRRLPSLTFYFAEGCRL